MTRTLFILNDGPYGSERSYNALRVANALSAREGEEVRVFLMGDAAACGKTGQRVPPGHYNLESMLDKVARAKGAIGACGTCLDARGIGAAELASGVERSTLAELAAWAQWAEKVLVF